MMRYISLLFAIIFLWFAYLQLNDPDPVWWVVIYLVPVYVSFMFFQQKKNIELLILLSIVYTAYAINLSLQISTWEGFFTDGSGMEMKTINQELTREVSGLLICVLVYIILLVSSIKKKKQHAIES